MALGDTYDAATAECPVTLCPTCNGHGYLLSVAYDCDGALPYDVEKTCRPCRGTGHVEAPVSDPETRAMEVA